MSVKESTVRGQKDCHTLLWTLSPGTPQVLRLHPAGVIVKTPEKFFPVVWLREANSNHS